MARFNSQRFRTVHIDGETVNAPEDARIIDVVPESVQSVTVFDNNGGSKLLSRAELDRPLPDGFSTNLSHVAKGQVHE
ncbi:MAG: hypothetical protein IT475_06285 [Aquimonas sp.]|nr:hypothetical protein [Aquimonas sp.]